MDKQPVGQLPDLIQSNNDDEIMIITNNEYNQLKKEKISDFITDLTSTDENNALIKGTDNKLFVTDFGNADNIINGTIDTERLPNSGVVAGKYIYPTNMQVNNKGQIVSVENGVTADITKEQIDTVAARPLSDNACTQEKFPDEYSYWVDQAHSTFDLSKFEVVGSPTISEDGIASGFSGSNYIKGTVSVDWSKPFIFEIACTTPKSISENFTSLTGIDLATPVIRLADSKWSLRTAGGTITDTDNIEFDKKYWLKLIGMNSGITFLKSTDGINYVTIGTTSANNYTTPSIPYFGVYTTTNARAWEGSIDLKSIYIFVDEQLVFSGNKTAIDTINDTLEIPYTETTDGTKIVDVAYFDRVQSCREQTGQALYLTLDEQNQAYYLPQGTVSGMISRNKQKILQAMPVGASIAYEGTTAPDGWFAESGTEIQQSAYPLLYAVVGDKYNLETTQEGYFRLPDTNISSRFYEGSTTPGTLTDAGLPNITGTFNANQLYDGYAYSSGAFQTGGSQEYPTPQSGSDLSQSGFNFNASRSSSVYGKSTTVQPKSITKFFIIKHD